MKRLKHDFKNHKPEYDAIMQDDLCIFCTRTGQELYQSFSSNFKAKYNNYIKNNSRNFKSDCKIFNLVAPCLTEEEYIIKQIIE